ncbi:MAG: hypothetical protein YFSK_1380 [Candidatus Yanofskyibacterium parasiticum]|nr:MAG: hypothetical protein YFSK_1380 [Candidatus Yanofskybacteria bacterium]
MLSSFFFSKTWLLIIFPNIYIKQKNNRFVTIIILQSNFLDKVLDVYPTKIGSSRSNSSPTVFQSTVLNSFTNACLRSP